MNKRQARAAAFSLAADAAKGRAVQTQYRCDFEVWSGEERAAIAAALFDLSDHLSKRAARMHAMDERKGKQDG